MQSRKNAVYGDSIRSYGIVFPLHERFVNGVTVTLPVRSRAPGNRAGANRHVDVIQLAFLIQVGTTGNR